jgi:hypothetical protein
MGIVRLPIESHPDTGLWPHGDGLRRQRYQCLGAGFRLCPGKFNMEQPQLLVHWDDMYFHPQCAVELGKHLIKDGMVAEGMLKGKSQLPA